MGPAPGDLPVSGRDPRRLSVGEHADAERYRSAWLDAMASYWHIVARSADLAPGSVVSVELLGRPFALWRGGDGSLGAVARQCPHRGVDLSLGAVDAQGCLVCPYHSWSFRSDGSCGSIPQLAEDRVLPGADTVPAQVAEAHGFVWMCLVPPGNERRSFPSYDVLDAGTHWFWMGELMLWDAQCLRQVENFCDVTHFSITHLDTFGNPAGVRLEPTRAERDGWSVRFDFDYPVFDPSVAPSKDRQSFPSRFEYDVQLPCSVLLGGASGPGSVMFIHATPLDVDRSMVFWGCAFPLDVVIDDAQYSAIEEAVWAPDRAMVQSQDPIGLPLGSRDERHLPMDRLALAYRRALADLGVPSSIPHNSVSSGTSNPVPTPEPVHA